MPVQIRHVAFEQVVRTVRNLCIDACHQLPEDVVAAIRNAVEHEESATGRHILQLMLQNAEMARDQMLPICQDTGVAVVFVEQGNQVFIEPPSGRPDATLADAVNDGVRAGYTDGYLRKSIVTDPAGGRTNTQDNTPAVIHHQFVPGDGLKLTVMPKGAGCENRSQCTMLTPAQGVQGVKDFVVNVVAQAGADACPPFVVGVGVGGNFESACLLSKKALLRRLDQSHPDPACAELEMELLERVNDLGIGPQGLGGRMTALAVLLEVGPCHIASLPVAVNIECHAHRHKSTTI